MKVNSVKTNKKFASNSLQNNLNKSFKGLMVLEDANGAIKVAITNHGKDPGAVGYMRAYGKNIPLGCSVWVSKLTSMLGDFQSDSIEFIDGIKTMILTKVMRDPNINLSELGEKRLALIAQTIESGNHKYNTSGFSTKKGDLTFSQNA